MQSRGSATWEGDLSSGKGRASAASGVVKDAPISWKERTEGGGAGTTPEELLATAHASCFNMALSHALAQAGAPPQRLETSCVVTFGPKAGGGGYEVKSSALEVRGQVKGMDEAKFKRVAEEAKEGCPISGALKNNVKLSVTATLA